MICIAVAMPFGRCGMGIAKQGSGIAGTADGLPN
jgi:hypothetical protein